MRRRPSTPAASAPRSTARPLALAALALSAVAAVAAPATAQLVAYGVTSDGGLFRFDPDSPATFTSLGFLGVVPEAIDFRPGTGQLYAIDVGPQTTQLYTVNIGTVLATGAGPEGGINTSSLTPVGPGFPSSGSVDGLAYALEGPVGFDFNPRTLQADGSVRIRVTDTSGTNLRLNSDTGLVAVVDGPLLIGTNAAFVDASAYINTAASTAAAAGTTTLFDIDTRNDALFTQNPPNAGTLNLRGGLGFDANAGVAFDIVSTSLTDDTIADERAFAALRRTGTAGGAYLLYDVNLATGEATGGRLVGGGLDFVGGLAVNVVPEPASLAGVVAAAGTLLARRRRAR